MLRLQICCTCEKKNPYRTYVIFLWNVLPGKVLYVSLVKHFAKPLETALIISRNAFLIPSPNPTLKSPNQVYYPISACFKCSTGQKETHHSRSFVHYQAFPSFLHLKILLLTVRIVSMQKRHYRGYIGHIY